MDLARKMIQSEKSLSARGLAAAAAVAVMLLSPNTLASAGNLVEVLRAEHSGRGQIEHWIEAIESEHGLRQTLAGSGTFTLFVPNDAAFQELYDLDACGAIELNANLLSTLLNHHVVRGAAAMSGAAEHRIARTRLGAPISIADETVRDTTGISAHFAGPSIEADNGVARVIDRVLWPFPAPACS